MKNLQLDSPYLILMVGIPGAGKSYFAKQFSNLFSIPLIDGLKIPNILSIEYFLPELLKTNKSIVVDSDTLAKKSREVYYTAAKQAGYKILTVWVQTDTETAKKRSDKNNKITGREINFSIEVRRFTVPNDAEKALVLSGKHTFATQTKVVLSRLTQPRASMATFQSKRYIG